MNLLTSEQLAIALGLLNEYLAAPPNPDGRTPMQTQLAADEERAVVIETQLMPLLRDYLDAAVTLETFKAKVDGINKREEYWGFKGIKGQMFFNLAYNTAVDK